MTMIIKDLFKNDNLAQRLMLCVITAHAQDVADGNIHNVVGWEDLSGKEVDVCLHINGVEVPFEAAMDRMEKCRNEWVKEEAFKLFEQELRDKFPDLGNLEDLMGQIEQKLRDTARETLGLELKEED